MGRHPHGVWGLGRSPDGKTVASGEGNPSGGCVVRLREFGTGQLIRQWAGHRNTISSLSFRPDGRALASGGWDGVVLVWDVTGQAPGRPKRPGKGELEALWEQLGGEAGPAYRAVWRLALAPEQAVPFLAGKLRPAPAIDAGRLARLVRGLDADRFDDREAASAERRRRTARLLRRLEAEAGSAGRLRDERALQALAHASGPAARRVLKRLAGGAAGVWLTREAGAVLQRLERQGGARSHAPQVIL